MSSFTSSVRRGEHLTCVVDLEGYLDAHTASNLEQAISTAMEQGCRKFVMNFALLDYISSAGLGVFMVFYEAIRADGGDIRMAAMQPHVFHVFDLLGFPVLFPIYNTVEDAIQSYA